MLSTRCIGGALAFVASPRFPFSSAVSGRTRLAALSVAGLALLSAPAATAAEMSLGAERRDQAQHPLAFDARPAWATARLDLLLSALAQSPGRVALPWRLAETKHTATNGRLPLDLPSLGASSAPDRSWLPARWSFGSPASLLGPRAHWVAPPPASELRDPPLVMASGGGGKDGGDGIVSGTPILPDSNPFEIPSSLEHWDVEGGDGEPPIVVPVPTPVVLGGVGLLGAWLARRNLASRVGRPRR